MTFLGEHREQTCRLTFRFRPLPAFPFKYKPLQQHDNFLLCIFQLQKKKTFIINNVWVLTQII